MRQIAFTLVLCAAASAQIKLPAFNREVLPNGAVVYLMPKAGLPLVHFRILVKGGGESEPAGLAGVASVTAELLRRGTGQRTAEQFAQELDSLGGTFMASPDEQATMIGAEFLKKDFDEGLGLVADVLLHANFPQEEVRKTLSRRADVLKSNKDNPQAAINSYYRSFFFGKSHPYGNVTSEASLDRIRREDIAAYYQRMYTGRNLVVIVTGDFDPAAAKTKIAAVFGAAPAGTAYTWQEDKPVVSTAPRLLLVDKPDATQTYFIISQPGVRRATPDRIALTVVNELFGGRFSSMLNEELRVNTGLTYGASSRVEMSRLTGGLAISTYTKTETTGRAIDLALEVLKRFHDNGITAEQLASAKSYLKGNYPPQHVETIDQLATVLGEMELFGLGRDEVDQFFARVDGVTLEQANEAIRRHYGVTNLTFVLLGNASKIREVAAKYAPQMAERSVKQPGWAE